MSGGAEASTSRIANVSKGQLEYQTSASGQWLPLQSYDNDGEPLSTIHTVIFREGNISFVQQTCGGAVSCGVSLLPVNYGSHMKIGTTESGPSMPSDIVIELTREEACLTSCLRSADAGNEPEHSLQRCPLARVCISFSAMRLYLPRDNFEPKLKRSSEPNEYWFKIVNALRRDLDSVPRPIPDGASAGERSIDLSSSPKGSLPPSIPKVNTTSVRQRFNDFLSSKKNTSPPKKASTSVQQAVALSETQRNQGQKAPAQPSKVQTPSPAATSIQKASVQKPPTTPQRQVIPPDTKQTPSPAAQSAQKQPATPQQQAIPPIPKRTSSSLQPAPKSKQTSSPSAKPVQKPPTTPQRQPVLPKPERTPTSTQPIPPKLKQTSSFVQPTPPTSKQASTFVQPAPPKSHQLSSPSVKSVQKLSTAPQRQPVPANPQQTSAFVQPIPPKLKQKSSLVPPAPSQSKQSSSVVQPAPPKPKQTSDFAQSQNSLIPKTINQKPMAKPPPPNNPNPRKIIDYKDLDSVVAVPSGSADLDYGIPAAPKQKGSAKEPERPKWEASIMQLQNLKEAAELEGDKAMAEKARKMMKLFEADAASPGKETKAKVDNFKQMWTLM